MGLRLESDENDPHSRRVSHCTRETALLVCVEQWYQSIRPTSLSPSGGSPEAIFMLAPLLLLLSQDPLMLSELEEQQRYFPPTLAVTTYLSAAAVLQVHETFCLPTTHANYDVTPFIMVYTTLWIVVHHCHS